MTAHDTSIVNWFTLNVQKPAVPSYTMTTTSCINILDTILSTETKSLRMVLPTGVDVLTASSFSNITNGAARLFLRYSPPPLFFALIVVAPCFGDRETVRCLTERCVVWRSRSSLPVISGATAWDARSYPVTAGQDSYSTVALISVTAPANDYYLSYAPPTSPTAGAYRLNITFCARAATNINLNTNGVGAVVQRNDWNFFSTQLTAAQYLAGLVYTMTPTLTGAQPVANSYFRTYAAVVCA